MNNNKNKVIAAIVIAVVIIAGIFRWWTGSPQHSMKQLREALSRGDVATAMTFFDTDALFESVWKEVVSEVTTRAESRVGSRSIGQKILDAAPAVIDNLKPAAKNVFIEALESSLAVSAAQSADQKNLNRSLSEKGNISMSGKIATLITVDGIQIILVKDSSRKWKISSIENFFDEIVEKIEKSL